jgi:hypothetical protein
MRLTLWQFDIAGWLYCRLECGSMEYKTVLSFLYSIDIQLYTACASYRLVGDGLSLGTTNFTLFFAIQLCKNSPITKILQNNILGIFTENILRNEVLTCRHVW